MDVHLFCFLLLGTDFNIDSLPLPRRAHHDWALFHEESPKNNYKLFHKPVITLFNYTATFSRHSHLPLTTQYLEGVDVLTSHRYLVPLRSKNSLRKRLAPLVYVQSDCDPPSDRDSYVRELMTYIEVDSYGECLRNRDLPQQLNNPASMDADGFYRIIAQYKFILAFENAVCDDYITEKFWRPLKLGVIPVYYGSPSITDWLPSNKSAILVAEFSHPRELASYIRQLDHDDRLYEAYIEWKLKGEVSNQRLLTALRERNWGVQDVNQDNYIDAFECMVCNKVWDNIRLQQKVCASGFGKEVLGWPSGWSLLFHVLPLQLIHYCCSFSSGRPGSAGRLRISLWSFEDRHGVRCHGLLPEGLKFSFIVSSEGYHAAGVGEWYQEAAEGGTKANKIKKFPSSESHPRGQAFNLSIRAVVSAGPLTFMPRRPLFGNLFLFHICYQLTSLPFSSCSSSCWHTHMLINVWRIFQ